MAKRKGFSGRKQREKDRERKRQKRLQQSLSSQPPDDQMSESAVPCGTVDGAVSAPPGNLPGQGSMGLPPIEEKPLARVQASPSVKMHSNAPRLSSPRGSRLEAQNGALAPTPDSPAWVCTPARVPGHVYGFKPSPAGQMQLDTSGMEETSSTLKKDEGFKDSIQTVFSRVSNVNLNSKNVKVEMKQNKNLDYMYGEQQNKNQANMCKNQESKETESSYESRENKNFNHNETVHTNDSSMYVQGSFHQGDPLFQDNAGTQCVANCLAGLSYHKVKNSKFWNTVDMNKILLTGDELYTYLQRSSSISNRYLLVEELPQLYECFDHSYEFGTNETLSSVILSDDGFNFLEFGAYSLDEALHLALSETDGCFICFGGNTLLIGSSGDGYFSFDSHSRSSEGLLSINGKSTRILFQDLAQVRLHIQSLAISMGYFRNVECNVTGVNCKVKNILGDRCNVRQMGNNVDHSAESSSKFQRNENDSKSEDEELCFVSVECERFFFVPLVSDLKQKLCQNLNLPYICNNSEVDSHFPVKELTEPCSRKEILGDGNCFFRAISFSLTNSEDYHYMIRSEVCKHLLENEDVFQPFLRNGESTVKEHISVSSMSQNGKWATELEILAVTHLMNIDIFTYTRSQWLRFSMRKAGSPIRERTGAIYLSHESQNHYNVVTKVCDKNVEVNDETLSQNKSRKSFAPKYNQRKTKTLQRIQSYREVIFTEIIEKQNAAEKRKQSLRRKYQENSEFREKKLGAAYTKYRDDEEFQSTVKERNRERYRKDTLYRSKTKSQSRVRRKKKYADNEENRKKSIEASVKKYMTNAVHKENVKARSVSKYKTNPVHKENVKLKSTEKYKTDAIFREDVKKRGMEKYRNDELYRENMKKRNVKKYRNDEKYKEQVKFTKRYKN